MNVKQVTQSLKPMEGYRILTINPHTDTRCTQSCVSVEHLPVDQRQAADQGNVILYNGLISLDGTPSGLTFWARDVEAIIWHNDVVAFVRTKHDHTVTIAKLMPL